MLEAKNSANQFDMCGRFRDSQNEREFQIFAWPEDRKALEVVAWLAITLYIVTAMLDFTILNFGTPEFFVSLTVRTICIVGTLGYVLNLRKQRTYTPFSLASFYMEFLVLSGYIVITALMPELAFMQVGAFAVLLIFVWIFVPLHPYFSMASTAVIMAGFAILHFRFTPDANANLFLGASLLAGVVAMGFLSARNRDMLRRSKFIDQQKVETANRQLTVEVEVREAAEKKEVQARERFEGLFRASPMPLVLTDHNDGMILTVNDACADLLGLPEEDIVGHHHMKFIDITEAYDELDRQVDLQPGMVTAELQVKNADGTRRDCMVSAVRFGNTSSESGQVLTGLYDITERKEFERSLVEARIAAENAQKSQSEFLATMSHEIRTPLNALLGFMQVMEFDNDITDNIRGNLGLARQSGEHLLRLITDILDLSHLASGKFDLEIVQVDCEAMCEETIETFFLTAQEQKVGIRYENHLTNGYYEFDELRVRQILFNLVGNAIKFTPSGEVILSVAESLHSTPTQPRLRVEIIDTGIGVDPEKIDHIFQEFIQADASVTREYGGTGLGLAISKKLVDAMGGEIGAHANSPAGSVFWFEIPVNHTAENCSDTADATTVVPTTEATAPPTASSKLLVAEDNPMNQRVISAFLDSLRLDHEIVANGQEAIERICAEEFALVLMDIQMPVLDGLSAIRLIRSGATPHTDIPIIALTANAMEGDRERYIAAGASGYLAKPVTLEVLRVALHDYVPDALATKKAVVAT